MSLINAIQPYGAYAIVCLATLVVTATAVALRSAFSTDLKALNEDLEARVLNVQRDHDCVKANYAEISADKALIEQTVDDLRERLRLSDKANDDLNDKLLDAEGGLTDTAEQEKLLNGYAQDGALLRQQRNQAEKDANDLDSRFTKFRVEAEKLAREWGDKNGALAKDLAYWRGRGEELTISYRHACAQNNSLVAQANADRVEIARLKTECKTHKDNAKAALDKVEHLRKNPDNQGHGNWDRSVRPYRAMGGQWLSGVTGAVIASPPQEYIAHHACMTGAPVDSLGTVWAACVDWFRSPGSHTLKDTLQKALDGWRTAKRAADDAKTNAGIKAAAEKVLEMPKIIKKFEQSSAALKQAEPFQSLVPTFSATETFKDSAGNVIQRWSERPAGDLIWTPWQIGTGQGGGGMVNVSGFNSQPISVTYSAGCDGTAKN